MSPLGALTAEPTGAGITTARCHYRARSDIAGDCCAERLADRSVKLPSQMVLNGCKLKVSTTGRYWISVPSSLQRDKVGDVVTEPHGKPRYKQRAEFADRAAENRFEERVFDGVREAHPELFDGGAA